ncbi:MAG: 2,3-bisphosphoglycerate-independent phosphoglycerate mutase [Chloroflexi bacterium]|nr:2,3-bisphosphoglycerate-independent phosphoglycerate mutase [Chloroflexota bacterium]
MLSLDLLKSISIVSPTRIVLLVIDGLGGLPSTETGKTELETAKTPNLDRLAASGVCGLSDPVGPGITPGSGAGHLALFGYDPVTYNVGRGVLEAVGVDFELQTGDIAVRGNFCAVDQDGLITDRRAGRISTEKSSELCRLLDGREIDGVKVLVRPVREHRFIIVFRGEGLSAELADSDPQQAGVSPKMVAPLNTAAARTAAIANRFVSQAKDILAGHHPANMILMRGFSQHPEWPKMTEVYKLTPAAIASYPMYRGLARLVGMKVLSTGGSVEDEFRTLAENYESHDFFFLHVKGADAAGEDGDFDRKVAVIEQVDRTLPQLLDLRPDVIVVTGDHSTPAMLKAHSWHPVPVLLSSQWCRPDKVKEFSESACIGGGLGRIQATQIMPLVMANALKLMKFGA